MTPNTLEQTKPIEFTLMNNAMSSVLEYIEVVNRCIQAEKVTPSMRRSVKLYNDILKVHYNMFFLYFQQCEEFLNNDELLKISTLFDEYNKIQTHLNETKEP